ncbi:MAG: aldehyde dehydrogenase family protein, partial [Lachnospiraceae bacterium]|nr:aldehyde dehydrogenase family protein [Lachnospiraceae bacterium]
TPVYDRAQVMYHAIDLIMERKEELGTLLMTEMGKPITQSRKEAVDAAVIARSFTEKACHMYGDVLPTDNQPGGQNDIIFTKREPLGVIGCIIPFNYPVKMFVHKVIPALLTGNAVIVKAPTNNPLTLMRLTEILNKAGLPEGLLKCVACERDVCNKWLVENDQVNGISLTGSTAAGINMQKRSAETLKHVFLELGGNDATIVREDADLDYAVKEITAGRMVNAGQTCCACKRILVHTAVYDTFVEKLTKAISEVKTGDPAAEDTLVGCLVSEKAARKVKEQIDLTVSQGAEIAIGGQQKGAVLMPTVIKNVTPDMEVLLLLTGRAITVIQNRALVVSR